MNKRKFGKKFVFCILVLLMLMIVSLSGCIFIPIAFRPQAHGWYQASSDGTKVYLKAGLTDDTGEFEMHVQDFKGFFYYDTVDYGSNWRRYRYKSSQTNILSSSPYDFFFDVIVEGLDRTKRYYYLAAMIYVPSEQLVPGRSSKSFLSGLPITQATGTWVHDGIVNFRGALKWHGGAASCEVWYKYGTTSDPDEMEWETEHMTLYNITWFHQDSKDLTGYDKIWFCLFASNDVGTTHSNVLWVNLT
ncbi:MAG: hypothetical protein KAW45_05040 [Thermoplasmatales archaeon]|nr:hypothetical protein [Thermoplasmatales archaeon]